MTSFAFIILAHSYYVGFNGEWSKVMISKKNTQTPVVFVRKINEIGFLLNLLELKSKKCELFSLPFAGTFHCSVSTFHF